MKERISCIYCWENLVNGKRYVGQTEDFYKRTIFHRNALKNGYDDCIALQNAYNKYEKENFKVYIIEKCSIENLDDREEFWIKELCSHVSENGYNILRRSSKGAVFTEERRKEMSKVRQGRGKENTSSKYVGVVWSKRQKVWRSFICFLGKKIFLGHYEYEVLAAEAYNNAAIEYYKKDATLNNISNEELEFAKNNMNFPNKPKRRKLNRFSKYLGVSYNKNAELWCASIKIDDKRIYIGSFYTEIESAEAYNNYAISIFGNKALLNDISVNEIEAAKIESEKIKREKYELNRIRKNKNSASKYSGVSYNSSNKNWVVNIKYNHKTIYIGSFPTEIEAALGWNESMSEYYGFKVKHKLNIIPQEEIDKLWELE